MSVTERPVARRFRFATASGTGSATPRNWLQLVRFGAVGAIGYAVNLIVFAICVHVFGSTTSGLVIAFVVSVINNFWWNRHWTFDAKEHHPLSRACASSPSRWSRSGSPTRC